jgi:hypothetical protein
MELHFPRKLEINRCNNLETSTYVPVNFLKLGYPRDFVHINKPPVPNAESVKNSIIHQINVFNNNKDKNTFFKMGTLNIYETKLDKRPIYCLIKKCGSDGGQRIYMSIHEAQHLINDLITKIHKGVEAMTKANIKPADYDVAIDYFSALYKTEEKMFF